MKYEKRRPPGIPTDTDFHIFDYLDSELIKIMVNPVSIKKAPISIPTIHATESPKIMGWKKE